MKCIVYKTYENFTMHYSQYQTHDCNNCNGILEMNIEAIDVVIDDRVMHFIDIPILKCINCGKGYLCEYSKKMIGGCYKLMLDENQYEGEFRSKGYKKRYSYCSDMNFEYDHRDYESIPGLCYDEEHSEEGFLTPVYFTKKSLIYFMHDPDYTLNLASETYGTLKYKDEWIVPFGINRNGKVIFWLGDLSYMDNQTLVILKPHNIESDHCLVDSEFYSAQMCCIWSNPNRELSLCYKKTELFDNIYKSYNISLHHLTNEVKELMESFQKPIVFTEKSIEPTINMLNKALIEGVNVEEFKKFYEKICVERKKGYKDWKSIKLYQSLLEKALTNKERIDEEKIKQIIAPLYLLNDLRNYYDHLLPNEERERIKNNIIQSFGLQSFDDLEGLYHSLLDGLHVIFEYLLLDNN